MMKLPETIPGRLAPLGGPSLAARRALTGRLAAGWRLAAVAVLAVLVAVSSVRAQAPRGAEVASLRDGSGLLVSAEWLAGHLGEEFQVVLHVGRDSAAYLAGHVPGAIFLPLSAVVVEGDGLPNELPPVSQLVQVFESVGVSSRSRVILYDDARGLLAARVFFTLDYLGLGDQAALLDGGLAAWRAGGRPVAVGAPQQAPPAPEARSRLTVAPRRELVVDAAWIAERLGSPGLKLIDARPAAQYTGEDPGEGISRPGHIPGAVNLFWQEALVPGEVPLHQDRETLRGMYRELGISDGDEIVTYCRTGMQASHAYFVARYLGFRPKMYDASYIDWSRRPQLPVER